MALKEFLSFDERKNFALPVSSETSSLDEWFFNRFVVEIRFLLIKKEKKKIIRLKEFLNTKIIDNSRSLAPSTIGREKFSEVRGNLPQRQRPVNK